MRKKIDFNEKWYCCRLDYSKEALEYECTKKAVLECVNVPHDAVIDNADNFYKDFVIWYRKKVGINPVENRKYILYFEGVYMNSTVWINGKQIFEWPNGYTSFQVDITEYISSADDEIAVRVIYQNPNSRWYAGPGITRNVWLYDLPCTHIIIDSLATETIRTTNGWNLKASVEVTGEGLDNHIEFILCDENGEIVSSGNGNSLQVVNPLLWNIYDSHLYRLIVNLHAGEEVIDSCETDIGFRELNFKTDEGLFINGVHTKLNGVCLHSDLGALGHAFHRDMARRQILLMKNMGVNAIRTSHNPPAPEFLDICDEEGIVVLDEAFDMWKLKKTTYDNARFFDDWHEKDVASWIRRDRNHPCVIMWSVGNEIYDTHNSLEGRDTMIDLVELVKKHDIYKHARVTLCSNYMEWENTMKCADDIKLIGYNYTERLYDEHHKEHPDWIIYGSETASCVQSRGIYHFPLKQSILADDDLQCSSLGNSTTSWGARRHDDCITVERDTKFSLGQFLWSGTDYIGEPTPYHTKNSYFGMADTAGFPKDAYYLYQAEWGQKDKPMIHVLPYWDFNPGQTVDLRICSNADQVELFKDGISLGVQHIDHENGKCLWADYQIPYSEGIIEARAYNSKGECIAYEKHESFKDAVALRLSEDNFKTTEDDDIIRVVVIEAMDEENHIVENANCRVKVTVEGEGNLVGLDNGDSTDYDSYKADNRRLFSGKLLAMIRSNKKAGEIKVSACIDKNDIPVRKLELRCDSGRVFTPKNSTAFIDAKVLPYNGQYSDIIWQITNDSGVEVDTAVIESVSEDKLKIKIKAVGDGSFRVRALVKDMNGKIIIISVLDFEANGFGEICLDPYKFVSGSLYTRSEGNVGNGNERGVSTAREAGSWVAYENINFGSSGTQKLTIPIFELSNEVTELIFWKGIPHAEGSSVCGRGIYDKLSIWNTYQEETFVLDEVLSGIQTFGIELHHKIHIKGFTFEPYNRAYECILVRNADDVYGDSFEVNEGAIEKIGNNVSIVFDNMNFDGALKNITICGRTPLGDNTIHVLFEDATGIKRQIVEFKKAADYEEQCFELEPLQGEYKVTFLFLPGSHFDFRWFKFS